MGKRVLVTGCFGSVGRMACISLQQRGHFVRGLDQSRSDATYDRSASPVPEPDEVVIADIVSDKEALLAAMSGIDVVIHLAAVPDDLGPFDTTLLGPNIRGVYNVCDAARECQVRRLMLTSSVQAVSGLFRTIRDRPITVADGTAPINHYGLTKVFAESIGKLYATGVYAGAGGSSKPPERLSKTRMSVVLARIGWFVRNTAESSILGANLNHGHFLSHDDAGRFFVRVVESPTPVPGQSATVFATSRTPEGSISPVDLTDAREILGYEPQDLWPEGIPFQGAVPSARL